MEIEALQEHPFISVRFWRRFSDCVPGRVWRRLVTYKLMNKGNRFMDILTLRKRFCE